jgi:hypothetical protein
MSSKQINLQSGEKTQSLLQREISLLILEITEENKDVIVSNIQESLFKGRKIPKISVELYIDRLKKYFSFEDQTLVLSLIYVDRFCEMNSIKLKISNFHRIFLVGIVIAIKFNEDIYYPNSFYSKIGGITLEDLNALEANFLKMIEYSLYIDDELFKKYHSFLQTLVKKRLNNLFHK